MANVNEKEKAVYKSLDGKILKNMIKMSLLIEVK